MLPPALASWRPELETLPRQLVLDLQPLLPVLASVLGPMRAPPVQGSGDPDGMDGLDRRGSYERLLASEWLLADEVPTEFLRRAVDGEHLFTRVRRVEPAASRRCVVLLDAGPEMLGAPRLVQLVAWLALARRARMAGAVFEWGVVQQPSRGLAEHMNLSAVRRWRAARCLASPDAASWAELLGPLGQDDERWWIGGPALGRPEGARVILREPLSLDREVSLQLERDGGSRTVQVSLPDEVACIRAFRQRLISPEQVAETPAGAQCVGWSADGRRLLVVHAHGVAESLHVPTPGMLAKQPPGRSRRCAPPGDGVLVAVGHAGRALLALAWRSGELLSWVGGRWHSWAAAPELDPPDTPGKIWLGDTWMFQDRSLAVWSLDDRTLSLLHPGPGRILFQRPRWFLATGTRELLLLGGGTDRTDVEDAVTGNRGLAYRQGRTWRAVGSNDLLADAPLGRVLGVAKVEGRSHGALIVHHQAQLLLVGEGRTQRLADTPDGLSGLWVNPRRPVVAWRTTQGALRVLDMDTKQLLLGATEGPA